MPLSTSLQQMRFRMVGGGDLKMAQEESCDEDYRPVSASDLFLHLKQVITSPSLLILGHRTREIPTNCKPNPSSACLFKCNCSRSGHPGKQEPRGGNSRAACEGKPKEKPSLCFTVCLFVHSELSSVPVSSGLHAIHFQQPR